jgi:hypothetical protein
MTKLALGLAGGFLGLGILAANATPLPPARPDAAALGIIKVQMDEGSTTVVKKHGLMGNKTTVIHRRSEPDTTGVVVRHRVESSDCKNVTVKKEDGMGNSVTKHKTNC